MTSPVGVSGTSSKILSPNRSVITITTLVSLHLFNVAQAQSPR